MFTKRASVSPMNMAGRATILDCTVLCFRGVWNMMRNADPQSDLLLVEPLSARELEILSHMADLRSNREIADRLVLSLNTVKWYARQIYGKLGVHNRRQAVSRARELGLLEGSVAAPLPRHNLPAQLTPFLGRQDEVASILELMSEPTTRLLTLVGPGGMGKTRLAIQAASLLRKTHRDSFRDGVFFVPLAAVSGSASILTALAEAIGFSFYRGKENPEQKLNRYLHQRRMLLVLDNFEHLIDGQGLRLLTEILAAAPGVRMMVTTRARLNMQGEYLVSLGGMAIPEIDSIARRQAALERAAAYSGIQLFLHSARRVRSDLELSADNLMPIARICALVQGVPLGIELAAAWMTVLEPDEIGAKIEKSLDFLQTDAIDVPVRQRSLRAVSDSSWSLLTEEEQLAVQRLSVFRGGFDRAGAENAGRVPLNTLVALVDKCWVQRVTGGRYQIHELLRQYGAEKLARDPALKDTARDQHSRYYCDWLSRQEEGIISGEQPPAWETIQGDIENVRAAYMWAARQGRLRRLEQAVNALGWFYYQGYGNYQQGKAAFSDLEEGMAAAEGWPSSATAGAQRTMARALAWQASMCSWLGDYPTSRRLLGESLALLDAPVLAGEDTRLERGLIAIQLGQSRLYADARTARQHFSESLELYLEIGFKWGMAYALMGLGRAARNLGAFEEARTAITQSLSLHQESGNRIGQSEANAGLGLLAIRQSRFREAEDLLVQSLSLTPPENRFGIANGLGFLALVQLLTGRFDEVEASISDCTAIWEEMGWRVNVVRHSITLARARVHAGHYRAARILAEEAVSLAREVDWGRGVCYAKLVLGEVALVEAAFGQAYQILQESLLGLQKFTAEPWDVDHSPFLGLAARGLGHRLESRQHLANAVARAAKGQWFSELMATLAGIALLLADEGEAPLSRGQAPSSRGQAERAVELYALASRYPFVANSRWFEDVAGRQMAAVADSLPPQVAAAARERGRGLDLEATMEELSVEVGRYLSPPLCGEPTTNP